MATSTAFHYCINKVAHHFFQYSHKNTIAINFSNSSSITRYAWQSLAYSPLGVVESPPSKYL